MVDKLKLDSAPPAYVKITKLPKHGELIVNRYGSKVVLKKGDLVSAQTFKDFMYDQGKKVCSSETKEKCKDSFAYTTFSEWVGKGPQQSTQIMINPVSREVAMEAGLPVAPLKSVKSVGAAPVSASLAQLPSKEVTSEGKKCSSEYPTGIVVGLAIVTLCLMVPLAVAYSQIKKLREESKRCVRSKEYEITEKDQTPKERES